MLQSLLLISASYKGFTKGSSGWYRRGTHTRSEELEVSFLGANFVTEFICPTQKCKLRYHDSLGLPSNLTDFVAELVLMAEESGPFSCTSRGSKQRFCRVSLKPLVKVDSSFCKAIILYSLCSYMRE